MNMSGESRFVEVFDDAPEFVVEYESNTGFGSFANGTTVGLERSALRVVKAGNGKIVTDAAILQWMVPLNIEIVRIVGARARVRSVTLAEIKNANSIEALEKQLLDTEVTVQADESLACSVSAAPTSVIAKASTVDELMPDPTERSLREALSSVLSENREQIVSFIPDAYRRDTLAGPLLNGSDGRPKQIGEWQLTFSAGCGTAALPGAMIGNVRGHQQTLRVDFCQERGRVIIRKWTIEKSNWSNE
jgi:hypothetical protein